MQKLLGSVGRWMTRAAGVVAVLALAACGGGGGGDGTASAGSGTLQVSMTDAPSCGFDHVWVTVQKVRVHQSATANDNDAGWQEITVAAPQRIDLLNLTNGVLQTLGSTPLPAGDYQQLRLVLADNSTGSDPLANAVQPTGTTQPIPLATPSAQQSGLKLQVHFTVQANQLIDLVIDFDACHSVVQSGNGSYILKPVISVTPKFVAAIQGYVATSMPLNATTVSAEQNGTIVRSTTPDSTGKFVLAYLPDGTYTVVITSDQHATGVVSSVPATTTTGTTSVNSTSSAIVLPSSAMGTVTGTVTASSSSGSTTSTAAVTDATVTALQSIGGSNVDVKSTPVNATNGSYSLSLPAAAPVLAPYSTSGLVFAPSGTAGAYSLEAASPTRGTQTKSATVTGGATTTVNFAY